MKAFPPTFAWLAAVLPQIALVAGGVRLRHALADAEKHRRRNGDLRRRVAALEADVDRLRRASSAAEHDKDEFLATLSHELRTPINAILGWVHLLRLHIRDAGEREHALDVLERNARRQVRIVDDLLDMSRIVTGKMQIAREPVDLGTVVHAAINEVRPLADAKDVTLQVETDEHVMVTGDRTRLRQVVCHIAGNAVKFTPCGGAVMVRLQVYGDEAAIEVTDTGVGIPQDALGCIFDRFRQAECGLTRPFEGLGLGLSIVRTLVELHGGTVEARSEGTGCGSTFIVRLPLARAGA